MSVVAALCALTAYAQPGDALTQSFGCGQPFVLPRDLRGITAVRLDVDGLPSPIEGSDTPETTLARAVSAQLSKAGIRVATEYDPEDPTLHIQVLVVNHPAQYFFVITAELYESCQVPRGGGTEIAFCTTWSVSPRLGFYTRGEPSTLAVHVAEVTKQFIATWSHDNRDDHD